jgi:uncharacterized protein (TIGR03086 family)
VGDGAGRDDLVTGTAAPGLPAEVTLFARAAGYLLESLSEVTDADLERPTPCGDWDLRTLLLHLADSADALSGLVATGELVLPAPRSDRPDAAALDPVAVAQDRTHRLLAVLTSATQDDATRTAAAARGGAIELAVHGWDVASACGSGCRMPPGLATALLEGATSLVGDETRQPAFGPPVPVPAAADPEDRLVAILGRRPLAPPAARGAWRGSIHQLVTSLVVKLAHAAASSTPTYTPCSASPRTTSRHRIGSRNRSTNASQYRVGR